MRVLLLGGFGVSNAYQMRWLSRNMCQTRLWAYFSVERIVIRESLGPSFASPNTMALCSEPFRVHNDFVAVTPADSGN